MNPFNAIPKSFFIIKIILAYNKIFFIIYINFS